MSYLLIDAGNSRIKWRLSDGELVLDEGVQTWSEWDNAPARLWREYMPQRVILASVAGDDRSSTIERICHERWRLSMERLSSQACACGVRSAYDKPERLGVDRWAAMIAAYHRAGGAVLVIDAGSAITCDVVDADGQHLGGLIAPGFKAMKRALGANVQLAWAEEFTLLTELGRNTESGMRAGISFALKGIADGARVLARKVSAGEYAVIICGGDAAQLRPLFDNAQVVESLVFEGMARMAATDGNG